MQSSKLYAIVYVVSLVMLITAGCVERADTTAKGPPVFLTVDFQQGQTLSYKFISERKILTNWTPDKNDPKGIRESVESVETIVDYEPLSVNPYGLSTIKATFRTVTSKMTGTRGKHTDAVNKLKGKSYTFTVGPDGKIHNHGELIAVLIEASQSAFRDSTKEPDLLDDLLTTQWYMWDAIAGIEKPAEGIKTGRTWKSNLLIPTSMVIRKARDVTYTLAEIRQTETGPVAVINSTYTASETKPDVPLPYKGSFRLAGTFGFFRAMFKGFSITSLEGDGQELFDINNGRIISGEQNYKLILKPNEAPLPGADPIINIEQKITMQLLDQDN